MKRFMKPQHTRFVPWLAALAMVGCGASADGGIGGAGGWEGTSAGTGGAPDAGPIITPLRTQEIALGSAHTCALLDGGRVACWGDGSQGQLGDGQMGSDYHRPVAAVVPGLTGVTAVRAGGDTTCAIAGGTVVCWGNGAFGQLGDGTAAEGHAVASPIAVQGLSGVVDLSVNGQNACAVAAGEVLCWGRNAPEMWLGFDSADCGPYTVQMGMGNPTKVSYPCESTPRVVDGIKDAIGIATGGEHNCAPTQGGGASCWGADNFGQVGDGVSGVDAHTPIPTPVAGIDQVLRFGLGTSHTCAVAGSAGKVLCWGDNSFGQLGIGSSALDSYKIVPTEVPGLGGVSDLGAAAQTSCAVLADQTVACWGEVSQVLAAPPDPKTGHALSPTPVPNASGAVGVRTGGSHACLRRADESVICWGLNDRGQLGNGTMGFGDFSMMTVGDVPPAGGPG
jgi:alpha-tubulin suppressor-like RCC1 family protein